MTRRLISIATFSFLMSACGGATIPAIDTSAEATPPAEAESEGDKLRVNEEQVPGGLDTHSLSPEAVVYLARTLFGATTRAFMLAIQGEHFDTFEERLSARAEQNLQAALDFFIMGQLSGNLYATTKKQFGGV